MHKGDPLPKDRSRRSGALVEDGIPPKSSWKDRAKSAWRKRRVTGTPEAFVSTPRRPCLWNEEDGAAFVDKILRDRRSTGRSSFPS